jgi:hypothetical protein
MWTGGGRVGDDKDVGAKLTTTGILPSALTAEAASDDEAVEVDNEDDDVDDDAMREMRTTSSRRNNHHGSVEISGLNDEQQTKTGLSVR